MISGNADHCAIVAPLMPRSISPRIALLFGASFFVFLGTAFAGVFSSQSEYTVQDFQKEPKPRVTALPAHELVGQVDTWSWNYAGSPPPGQTGTLQWFIFRPE